MDDFKLLLLLGFNCFNFFNFKIVKNVCFYNGIIEVWTGNNKDLCHHQISTNVYNINLWL